MRQHGRSMLSDSDDDFIDFDQVIPNTDTPCDVPPHDIAINSSQSESSNSNEMSHASANLETQSLYDNLSEWPRRERRHPKRLDITSWRGKSYDV